MNTLIPLYHKLIGSDEVNSVNARELHEYFQSKSDYSTWIKNRIKKYGFTENQDYIIIETKKQGNNATLKDYYITLDMGKELSMVESNEKGRKIRKYFIQIEKEYREALNAPIRTSNVTILDVRRELTTAKLRLTLEKKKHRATAEYYEAKIAHMQNNDKLIAENKALKRTLIDFSNRYHTIVLEAEDKVQAIKSELTKMTNCFQLLPNLANDGKNLNTETMAKHSYW